MKKPWWTAVVIAALLSALGGWAARASLKETVAARAETTPAWAQRLALVDEAVASNNVSAAIYQWREAYGLAIGSRRSEVLASVGDAALRIDTLAGSRGVFHKEARDAYHGSMLLAHAQRDVRTMLRAADSLALLGDARAADRARHMVQGWARREAS